MTRWFLVIAASVGLGLRIFLATAYFGTYDQESYEIVVAIFRRGGNVYAETRRYNYAPVWGYTLLSLSYMAEWLHLPFHVVVRSFLTMVDGCNALLIGAIAVHLGVSRVRSTLAYWLNPAAIIIVGFAGQFDTLALLPLLGAVYLWLRTPDRPPTVRIWLLCVAALLVKHLIIFHVWMLLLALFPRRRALRIFSAALLVWAGSFVPFVATGAEGILDHVLLYNGWFGVYGFGKLLPFRIAPALFYMIMIVLPLIITDKRPVQPVACLTMASVALIAFLHGIGPHYLLIPLVWGSIARGRWYWVYSAAALFVLLGVRDFLHLYRPPLWELAWLSALGWLGWCLLMWWNAAATRQTLEHAIKHLPKAAGTWLQSRT